MQTESLTSGGAAGTAEMLRLERLMQSREPAAPATLSAAGNSQSKWARIRALLWSLVQIVAWLKLGGPAGVTARHLFWSRLLGAGTAGRGQPLRPFIRPALRLAARHPGMAVCLTLGAALAGYLAVQPAPTVEDSDVPFDPIISDIKRFDETFTRTGEQVAARESSTPGVPARAAASFIDSGF